MAQEEADEYERNPDHHVFILMRSWDEQAKVIKTYIMKKIIVVVQITCHMHLIIFITTRGLNGLCYVINANGKQVPGYDVPSLLSYLPLIDTLTTSASHLQSSQGQM